MDTIVMQFSLIIPTLNRTHDLSKTLTTIFITKKIPQQIIIIDQSDDTKTKDLVQELNNPIIQYYHFSVKSLTQARNYAIQKLNSKTDLVFFLDDDISVDLACFTHVVAYMIEHTHIKGGLLNIHTPSRHISLIKKIGFFLLTGSTHFDEQYVTAGGFNTMFLGQPIEKKSIQRCSGCGMFFRKEVFDQGFRFPDTMLKYSLMEDVFFSYAIHRQYPDSLIYLPQANIIHHESPAGRITNTSKMKQQVIHRFLFVKEFGLSYIGYVRTIFLLMMMDILQYRSYKVVSTYVQSLVYIIKNHKSMTIHDGSWNTFIFGEE